MNSDNPISDPQGNDRHHRAVMLGHDIRNAVADILGGFELADLSGLDQESRSQICAAKSASEQLARLSDEVLALVTGDLDPKFKAPSTLDLVRFLQSLTQRWPDNVPGRTGVTLVIDDDLPNVIATPSYILERVLVNLIGNAIKHTPENGSVKLHVELGARESVIMTVADTGTGFSNAALAQLFEPGGRPAESDTPGTGLGLYIVRDLVHQMGGRLQVGNGPKSGALVKVLLPRAAWAPGISEPEAAADLPNLAGQHVLVAEDNLTNQLLICQMLETLGATHSVAPDGRSAIVQLNEKRFDFALIDIEMPRMSGLDVIKYIRAGNAGNDRLPILAVTAFVLSANRAHIYDAGADGVLAKPIMSIEAFGEAIDALLNKRAPNPIEPTGVEAEEAFGVDALHLDRLLALAGEEQGYQLMGRLIQDFAIVRRELHTAVAECDFKECRGQTHVLISLAGALGSNSLQTRAEHMNAAATDEDFGIITQIAPDTFCELDEVIKTLSKEINIRYPKGSR